MLNKNSMIKEIVLAEWAMFQEVQNEGGRADCQEDWPRFKLFRSAQFMTWSDAALSSYLRDIQMAEEDGRNLLSEKYAYMMESTDPQAFAEIKAYLPEVTAEKRNTINELAEIYLRWNEDFSGQDPSSAGMRSLRSSSDNPENTSYETYLKGELATYSQTTLDLLLTYVRQCQADSVNLIEQNLSYIRGQI